MSKYTIVPYDGKSNISDHTWHYIWNKIEEQGLKETIFCTEGIDSAYDFVTLMRHGVMPSIVVDNTTDPCEPVAMGWLADINNNKAGFGHFLFFKELWGTRDTVEVGRMAYDFWFNGIGMNVLLGIVPSFNTHAVSYIEKLGMKVLGEIPNLIQVRGSSSPAIIAYITKEMFECHL